ncbi:MFS general substrate transporter [Dendrothele bispora CBS 962.96]|uniref:MFS general substrate transporter n=1 Tax=Dendrothele bispora (strain CBS 962.96) TaxID=1314807 RepID=A0A4S8KVU6_DENBC|nr:MFS general substrate transporter [Dendrothele bispora CBS 962.96]
MSPGSPHPDSSPSTSTYALQVQDSNPDICPEGTLHGWLSVLGGFCLSLATLGFLVSWGTFQAYYEETLLSTSTSSQIAWIGSLQNSLIFLPGIVSGKLFDAGHFHKCLIASSIIYITAGFLIAECTKYWHFILCQGLALGISTGIVYVPCVALVSQWFERKRPLAISLLSLGISIGGIIYPLIFRSLINKIGFAWTIRVIAFINLCMFAIGNTMVTRMKPSEETKHWIDFKIFAFLPYTIYVLATFTAFLGIYTVLTFVSVRAASIGFSQGLSFDLVAISNALTAVGRLTGGMCATKYGALNVIIIFTAVTAVVTFIWPFVDKHGGYLAVICFYGLSSGAFVGLCMVPVAALGRLSDFGRRAGMQMTIMALGALIGPPISGAILNSHGFQPVGIYAGELVAKKSNKFFTQRLYRECHCSFSLLDDFGKVYCIENTMEREDVIFS